MIDLRTLSSALNAAPSAVDPRSCRASTRVWYGRLLAQGTDVFIDVRFLGYRLCRLVHHRCALVGVDGDADAALVDAPRWGFVRRCESLPSVPSEFRHATLQRCL